jgi:hypothetical protein
MAADRKWITSMQLCDGLWEACKHMLYGDQMTGHPWPNELVKTMAFSELDAYEQNSPMRHTYEEWHRALGTAAPH